MATLDFSGSEHWTQYFFLRVELWCPSKLLWSSDYMTFTLFEMEWGIHRPRLGGRCQGAVESLSTCFTFCTQFRKKEECNILMIYTCKIPIYVLETCLTHPPPSNFCRKMLFEASRAVFQSLSGNKELNKTYYKAAPGSLLIQLQNISLRSWGMHGKQNFKTFSPPLFFCLSCSMFFFCWAFSRLHFLGR